MGWQPAFRKRLGVVRLSLLFSFPPTWWPGEPGGQAGRHCLCQLRPPALPLTVSSSAVSLSPPNPRSPLSLSFSPDGDHLPSQPRSPCLVVPWAPGMPARVSRGPSFQSLGVLSLSFSGAGGPGLSRASTCPALVLPRFLLVTLGHALHLSRPPPICEMGEELGENGVQRAKGLLSDWTTLPTPPAGEMVHADGRAGHTQAVTH